MRAHPSARFALRAATADHHARIDTLFAAADLALPSGYAAFLVAQARGFLPAEAALERDGIAALLPDWAERGRATALRADLAALGLAVPPPAGTIAFADEAALLGGAYVLEGSRLGGAMLLRSVGEGLPARFLAPAPPRLWRDFIATLDARLTDAAALDRAADAATRVFSLFAAAGQAMAGEEAA